MVNVSTAVKAKQLQSSSSVSIRQLLLALCTLAVLLQPASCSAHNQVVQFLDSLPQLNASSAAIEPLNLIIVLRVGRLL